MPLTPLPSFNTKRYFVGLADANAQHHIQIRCADTVSDAAALTDLGFTFGLIAPVTYDDYEFNELLVAENGSDIRNPVSGWTPIPGTASFAQADREFPLGITARGRSSTGRKVKLTLWGQFFTVPTNWLYLPTALGDHASFIAILQTSSTYFLAIDGTKPVWRDDFTVDYNDHWVQKARP
jgi:hypothetical protein